MEKIMWGYKKKKLKRKEKAELPKRKGGSEEQ